jgi:TetR/AcrR family transcriptional repressor of lmrAB and yxaGH operons
MAPVQKHRQALIDSSVGLFQRQGYAATGLAEILAESGAPRGSLYHYFPDGKEAIGEAALQSAAAVIAERLNGAAAGGVDPRVVVRRMAAVMAGTLVESGYTRSCPIASVALETSNLSERLSKASREAIDLWTSSLAAVFCAGGIAEARARALADFALGTMEGAFLLARVRRSVAPLENAADEVVRVLALELPATGE